MSCCSEVTWEGDTETSELSLPGYLFTYSATHFIASMSPRSVPWELRRSELGVLRSTVRDSAIPFPLTVILVNHCPRAAERKAHPPFRCRERIEACNIPGRVREYHRV